MHFVKVIESQRKIKANNDNDNNNNNNNNNNNKDVLKNFVKFTEKVFARSFLITLQAGNLKLSEAAIGDV